MTNVNSKPDRKYQELAKAVSGTAQNWGLSLTKRLEENAAPVCYFFSSTANHVGSSEYSPLMTLSAALREQTGKIVHFVVDKKSAADRVQKENPDMSRTDLSALSLYEVMVNSDTGLFVFLDEAVAGTQAVDLQATVVGTSEDKYYPQLLADLSHAEPGPYGQNLESIKLEALLTMATLPARKDAPEMFYYDPDIGASDNPKKVMVLNLLTGNWCGLKYAISNRRVEGKTSLVFYQSAGDQDEVDVAEEDYKPFAVHRRHRSLKVEHPERRSDSDSLRSTFTGRSPVDGVDKHWMESRIVDLFEDLAAVDAMPDLSPETRRRLMDGLKVGVVNDLNKT